MKQHRTTTDVESKPVAPPLKWAGGKRWQVPQLRAMWAPHAHRRLVEPFCGGIAVALGLNPGRALLNDVNPHLVNFYQQVQRGLVTGLLLGNRESDYYEGRARFNEMIDHGTAMTPAGATLFYYLNRTGFNGLCRFNASGKFNVPFGKYKAINYRADFLPEQAVLQGWEFSCGDFAAVCLAPDDFVYADPPYDVEFTTYAQGGFFWADQVRTAERLASHLGPVILANQSTPRIRELYADHGFSIVELDAPRRISCTGDRAPAKEVLATRNISDHQTGRLKESAE